MRHESKTLGSRAAKVVDRAGFLAAAGRMQVASAWRAAGTAAKV
jgi:hypothetical protein